MTDPAREAAERIVAAWNEHCADGLPRKNPDAVIVSHAYLAIPQRNRATGRRWQGQSTAPCHSRPGLTMTMQEGGEHFAIPPPTPSSHPASGATG